MWGLEPAKPSQPTRKSEAWKPDTENEEHDIKTCISDENQKSPDTTELLSSRLLLHEREKIFYLAPATLSHSGTANLIVNRYNR